ncbi:hypothetical protein GGI12_000210 [Dipsacomyces acuminosporus]|nr:hypothetical protein GGI12_000210 [Dipsacomyces acuminosporus]
MSSSLAKALDDSPNLRLHKVFGSLAWAESVLWDSTGSPDAFARLLASCSSISLDRSKAQEHQDVALKLLNQAHAIGRKSIGDYQTLKQAVQLAMENEAYANGLANLCGIHYFLRRLDAFSLDDQSLSRVIDSLKLFDQTDLLSTHESTIDALNACLGQLEARYPGIKQYTNCAMLETNVGQEFGLGPDQFAALRSALPADGELYLDTLRCIAGCLQKNLDTTETLQEARRLYSDSALAEYWIPVSNFIWDLQNSMEFDDDDENVWDEEDIYDYEDGGHGIKHVAKKLSTSNISVGFAR